MLVAPGAGAQPFEERRGAFPVVDGAGQAYAFPFLGGLDVPRPQLVDIDADGDEDLFVQEESGRLLFFEHVGGGERYRWRTDDYGGLDVGEWARFADLDGDGDFDLLAEQPFSLVRYYRNEGTPAEAAFVLAADTLRDAAGDPIFADAQNTPALADLLCRGRPDLFLGKLDGTLTRYAHEGVAGGLPVFRLVDERYQDVEIVGAPAKTAGTRHGANALTFADLDADADLDLLWGDFFSSSLYLIRNDGHCEAPRLVRAEDLYPPGAPLRTGGFNAPAAGDVDGDGDLDLLVGVLGGAFGITRDRADNLFFLRQEDGRFSLETTRFLSTPDVGEDSHPALGDLDGDGDLDLLLGSELGGTHGGRLAFFRNEGGPAAPSLRLVAEDHVRLDSVRYSLAPALGDLDGDGDLDLLVGESAGTLNHFRNAGTPAAPRFELETETFAGIRLDARSRPALVDLEGDGDLDLLVGSAEEGVAVYRAAGGTFVRDPSAALDARAHTVPAAGDLDADGDPDVVGGSQRGGLFYFENRRVTTGRDEAPSLREGWAVYPNPFAVTATVRLDLGAPGRVRLEVYDLLGRRVATLAEAAQAAGAHLYALDGAGLPAGAYLVVLAIDGRPAGVRRVVRVRP